MVAALDDVTGVSYTELLEMDYEKMLRLNLDARAHAKEKQDAIDKQLDQ